MLLDGFEGGELQHWIKRLIKLQQKEESRE
jgi:hypothetical protein